MSDDTKLVLELDREEFVALFTLSSFALVMLDAEDTRVGRKEMKASWLLAHIAAERLGHERWSALAYRAETERAAIWPEVKSVDVGLGAFPDSLKS